MALILTILGIPLGLFGLFLIGLFLWMRLKDGVEVFEIKGFQERKNKGRHPPIVEYEDEEGVVKRVEVHSIWNIGYLISPPIEREEVEVSGARQGKPRVFGYLGLLSGVVMLIPGLVAIGLRAEQVFFVGQLVFIIIMIGAILGGWLLMKFIQKL